MINILYIHGFMSSPLSYKAQLTEKFLAKYYPNICYHCPQLNESPSIAVKRLTTIIESSKNPWFLIGSSLGGYYATYLSERYQLKAVLVNPAIKPYELLKSYLGEQKNYHTNDVVNVKLSYMDELKAIEQEKITKKNYLLMAQTGDEVLDYQQAVDKFINCQQLIEQGGDHSFINFQEKLPEIMKFFNLLTHK